MNDAKTSCYPQTSLPTQLNILHIPFCTVNECYTIQLKSLNIALNNYFTDYPDSKLYGGIKDEPTDFKSEDIICYALASK